MKGNQLVIEYSLTSLKGSHILNKMYQTGRTLGPRIASLLMPALKKRQAPRIPWAHLRDPSTESYILLNLSAKEERRRTESTRPGIEPMVPGSLDASNLMFSPLSYLLQEPNVVGVGLHISSEEVGFYFHFGNFKSIIGRDIDITYLQKCL